MRTAQLKHCKFLPWDVPLVKNCCAVSLSPRMSNGTAGRNRSVSHCSDRSVRRERDARYHGQRILLGLSLLEVVVFHTPTLLLELTVISLIPRKAATSPRASTRAYLCGGRLEDAATQRRLEARRCVVDDSSRHGKVYEPPRVAVEHPRRLVGSPLRATKATRLCRMRTATWTGWSYSRAGPSRGTWRMPERPSTFRRCSPSALDPPLFDFSQH